MSVQVLHEAEHTRQHTRYTIPASIEINSRIYKLDNWSVNGLAIKNIENIKQKFFDVKLIFDFESFHIVLDINLEKNFYDYQNKILRCIFFDLTKDKLSLFHYIINAYVSGELVTLGSLMQVVKKDSFTSKDMSKVLNPDMSLVQKVIMRTRQIATYIALSTITFGLLGFILYSTYNKIFIVESLSASINAPVIIIRSPQASYYSAIQHSVDSQIKRGNVLASMKLIGGGANSIESPIDGKILIEHTLDKSFVDKGEPLLTIVPKGITPYIEAKIKASKSSKLLIGQSAKVQLINGEVIKAKVTSIKSADSRSYAQSNPLQTQPTTTFDYIIVILEPASKLDIKRLGEIVSVKINTFNLLDAED